MRYEPSDITVGVRAYNRPKFLRDCLKSIRSQSISGFNVLVVDDSDDADFAYENNRICVEFNCHYIKPEKHLKLGGRTLNYVLKNTNTKIISFIDDDDFWHTKKLELQLNMLNSDPKIGLVTCSQKNFTHNDGNIVVKEDVIRTVIPEYQNLLNMSGRFLGPPSAVMIKANIISELGGFNEDIPRGPCQLLFRKIRKNYEVASCPEILLYYRVHDESITGAFGKCKDKTDVQSRLIKLQELRDDFDRNPRQRFLEEKAILKLTLRGVKTDEMQTLLHEYGTNLKIIRPPAIRLAKFLWQSYCKING